MLLNTFLDAPNQACHQYAQQLALIDWTSLQPYFSYQSEEVINATYQVTSQYAGTIPTNHYLKKCFKSHNPVLLQLTQSWVTCWLLMMVVPWLNSSVAMRLWFVMSMVPRISSNLSIPFLTTSASMVPWKL